MNSILLTAIGFVALTGSAFAQSPQEHQQHHPGGGTSAKPPSASTAQPRGPMPIVRGMMPSQGQSGSGMMTGGQSGMMMSWP
jgi:hypothetical protein